MGHMHSLHRHGLWGTLSNFGAVSILVGDQRTNNFYMCLFILEF